MTANHSSLELDHHFQSQLDPNAEAATGRVSEVHRDRISVFTAIEEVMVTLGPDVSSGEIAVGDWVTFEPERRTILVILDRRSTLSRKMAGSESAKQLIAANVDTLFIVTSCNADFNVARLERYLTLAASGDIIPVIVLTKADLVDAADEYKRKAERLSSVAKVVTVNALDPESVAQLDLWLRNGGTGALVGSSGVGKSTILNALTDADALTQGVREDDAKGRHTTTSRSLKRTRSGGWLIDTPGIRQLALVDGADAIDKVFTEISELTERCRFSDCSHETEPGCAVCAAVTDGVIDPERVERWRKLHLEDRKSSETYEETRKRQKASSKKTRPLNNGSKGKKR